ncbi:hypothetical protein [Deinococcus humi]|uniref:Uncharacterized protein n=1 Tax=Deinococcus humi TaxID=662880 RepID=A0A7W8NFY3_9DEIO|nr:hypothetical protein [Deinococcus humi]MBB5364245.1 hypothetical protein [Deinococcus humi]GGO35435.1 hypothetical protein GCM10008949_37900 [Deinococcus humi]
MSDVKLSKPEAELTSPEPSAVPSFSPSDPVDPGTFDLASYGAALPRPEALSAEQFLPVLTPAHFTELLDDLRGELQLVPDEAARSALTSRARILRLNVEQYRINFETARVTVNRVLAETGVGVRGSWARQQDHLNFMNAASGDVEREYLRATEEIERARQQRFEALTSSGVPVDVDSAEAFYQEQALAELAREGHALRPPEGRSGSKKVFNAFAVFSKFFVGIISGVSINLLFNPESRLYMTIIALTAGIMFSVLLLWLVDELAYRAKLAARTPGMARPGAYIGGILAVTALYLGVEGYLNWDGILRVTQQIAANAAQQGQLTDLNALPDTPTEPQHWSLLVFTLALVSMAAGAAFIQGRERARALLERERLAARVAELKADGRFAAVARAADHVGYLETARDRLAPPRDVTSPDHARLNERVLNHWEQEREGQIQSVAAELVREARAVQDALEAFAQDLTGARHPQERRRFGFL